MSEEILDYIRLLDAARDASQQGRPFPALSMWRQVRFLEPRTEVPSEVGVQSSREGAQCRVLLSGRITLDSAPDVRLLLFERLNDRNCQELSVDLFDIVYIDASGLAILVEALRAA